MSTATLSRESTPDDFAPGQAPQQTRTAARRTKWFRDRFMTAAQLVACTLAVIAASAGYQPFFAEPSFLIVTAGAAILAAACGVAVAYLHKLPVVWWALSLVSLVAYLTYLVYPGTMSSGLPGITSLRAITEGLLHGVAKMLTITPPVDVEPALLIVPVTLAFVASFAAAVLIRRKPVLLPVLPPSLAFLAALLLSANGKIFQWQITCGFLLCAFVIILLRANAKPRTVNRPSHGTVEPDAATEAVAGRRAIWHGAAGRVLLGVPLVAVVVTSATAAVHFLPVSDGSSRFDLRDLREPPLTLLEQLNPLVDVRRQIEQETTATVFTVHTDDGGPLPVDRIRVAALDRYDGVQWTSGAEFVRTGSTLPVGSGIDNPQTSSVDITLTGAFTPPFLPEYGQPRRVEAQNLGFDPASGLLVTGDRALDGYHFRLTTALPAGDIDPATATPAEGADFDRWRQLPQGVDGDPGAEFAAFAGQVTASAGNAYHKLEKLAEQLKSSPYALEATPGHSYAALDRFLPNAPAGTDVRVTEEQTVAAFVIMARSLGYPARVAVGYRINPAAAVDGTYTVQVSDADAWAEVAFAGRGWVPFSPTAPRDGQPPPPPPPVDPSGNQGPTETVRPDSTGSDVSPDGGAGIDIPWAIALTVLIPLVVVLLLIGTLIAIKQLRRRRRRTAGTTSDRIIGAWQESTNRLRENGFLVPTVLTPVEIGDRTTERFGAEAGKSVATMAPLVAEAVFAPEQPDEEAVVRAWDLEGELRSILDGRRSVIQNWLTWIDPRPLLPGGSRRG
jgi:hypothetical protein